MMAVGFGLWIIATIFFCFVRPDHNKGHKLSSPILYGMILGLALMLASFCVWLYRVMP